VLTLKGRCSASLKLDDAGKGAQQPQLEVV
jgi:hypothetical protein